MLWKGGLWVRVCVWVSVCMNDNVFVCISDIACGGGEEGEEEGITTLCLVIIFYCFVMAKQ